MVLCAGRGARMRPLTDHCPKPLLQAGGQSLLGHILRRIRAAGLRRVVINHAYLGAQIESAIGDGHALGLSVRYSAEASALETAGGIATALPLLGSGRFLVINGDTWSDIDLAALAQHAQRAPAEELAHLVLVDNPEHNPGGDFWLAGERISSRAPATPADALRLTFSGTGVYHPALFQHTAPGQAAPLAPLLRAAMDTHHVSGRHHKGAWRDIGRAGLAPPGLRPGGGFFLGARLGEGGHLPALPGGELLLGDDAQLRRNCRHRRLPA